MSLCNIESQLDVYNDIKAEVSTTKLLHIRDTLINVDSWSSVSPRKQLLRTTEMQLMAIKNTQAFQLKIKIKKADSVSRDKSATPTPLRVQRSVFNTNRNSRISSQADPTCVVKQPVQLRHNRPQTISKTSVKLNSIELLGPSEEPNALPKIEHQRVQKMLGGGFLTIDRALNKTICSDALKPNPYVAAFPPFQILKAATHRQHPVKSLTQTQAIDFDRVLDIHRFNRSPVFMKKP
jgi:hypothetical protein